MALLDGENAHRSTPKDGTAATDLKGYLKPHYDYESNTSSGRSSHVSHIDKEGIPRVGLDNGPPHI